MFLLTDLERILQNTSGKYCVGDEVGHITLKRIHQYLGVSGACILMQFEYDGSDH